MHENNIIINWKKQTNEKQTNPDNPMSCYYEWPVCNRAYRNGNRSGNSSYSSWCIRMASVINMVMPIA